MDTGIRLGTLCLSPVACVILPYLSKNWSPCRHTGDMYQLCYFSNLIIFLVHYFLTVENIKMILPPVWLLYQTLYQRSCANAIKLFYGPKLHLFIISWRVGPWKAFPARSNVCAKARSLP